MKKLLPVLLLLAATVFLSGCANPRYQNMAEGGLIGGAIGALVGDSSRAARIGAGLGMMAGAALPIQQVQYPYPQQYGQGNMPPGMNCPPGSMWDGRGCRIMNGNPGYNQYPPQYPPQYGQGNMPPGMNCPPGSVWDGRGCRIMNGNPGYNQYPYPQQYGQGISPNMNSYPQPAMQQGSWQSDPRTCPRVMVPGGGWRC